MWEARYREYAPKLSTSVEQAMEVFPKIYREETDRATSGKVKLLEMEDRAFDLIRPEYKEAMESFLGPVRNPEE